MTMHNPGYTEERLTSKIRYYLNRKLGTWMVLDEDNLKCGTHVNT